ncbi:MAG: DUF5906 domain-containing protein [Rickettsiales bacterium]|nr:DUF5906 domain-containing protein [Rickettsiales bacterium]
MSKIKGESAQSIKFLKRYNPTGPWVLTCIQTDRKGISTTTFYPETKDKLKAWLDEYNGKRNIYFHVNSPMRDLEKKANREDIKSVDYLHVDIDPREGQDIEKEREMILELLTTSRPKNIPKPTCIIFSGGGFQAFWKLKEPMKIDGDLGLAEDAKRYNQQIELLYAADNCHNIDRIMRLPGTINIPDAKKLKKGRKEELATLVDWDDEVVYDIGEFAQADKKSNGVVDSKYAVKLNNDTVTTNSLDELDKWDVSDRIKVVIAQGKHPDEPKPNDNSRSAWLFDVACDLVRQQVPDEVVFGILTDPQWGISESVVEKGNGAEKYAIRQIERAIEFNTQPELAELNEKHAVIANIGGKCRIAMFVRNEDLKRDVLSFQSFSDFTNTYMNCQIQVGETKDGEPKFMPLGKWWLLHPQRRQYESIGLHPKGCSDEILNLWQGFATKAKQGDWSLMQKHILNVVVCGNVQHYEYVLKWLAFAVQHPEKPAEVALVLKGGKGTGKGAFANAMCKIFGQHGWHISDAQHLSGRFNAHLGDTCFVFADEAYWPGNKSAEGNLKSLITEPTLTIERKGVDAEQTLNMLHVVMASNEDWIVPASEEERRFAVFEVSSKYQQNREYFDALFAEQSNGGLEAMLYDLLNMDISGWHPRYDFPRTKALHEQMIAGLNPVEKAWFDRLVTGECLFENQQGELYHLATHTLVKYASDLSPRRNASPHSVATFLGISRYNADGSRKQSRCMGFDKDDNLRPRGFWVPELHIARKIWDQVMFPYEWGDARDWHNTQEGGGMESPF